MIFGLIFIFLIWKMRRTKQKRTRSLRGKKKQNNEEVEQILGRMIWRIFPKSIELWSWILVWNSWTVWRDCLTRLTILMLSWEKNWVRNLVWVRPEFRWLREINALFIMLTIFRSGSRTEEPNVVKMKMQCRNQDLQVPQFT